MRKISIILFLMNFIILSAQTFTINELETYSKYDFDIFSDEVMSRGYELEKADNETIMFSYTSNSLNDIYIISFFKTGVISYSTTSKNNYTNLINGINKKGYKYIESIVIDGKNTVCKQYQNDIFAVKACIGLIEVGSNSERVPSYEIQVYPYK